VVTAGRGSNTVTEKLFSNISEARSNMLSYRSLPPAECRLWTFMYAFFAANIGFRDQHILIFVLL